MVLLRGNTADSVCVGCGSAPPAGAFTRFSARIAALVGVRGSSVARVSIAPEEVLKALPPEASAELRAAIASGCCTHYTVAEGKCVAGGCGTGKCCYHVVSTECGIDQYECLDYPCSHGNFSSGC